MHDVGGFVAAAVDEVPAGAAVDGIEVALGLGKRVNFQAFIIGASQ